MTRDMCPRCRKTTHRTRLSVQRRLALLGGAQLRRASCLEWRSPLSRETVPPRLESTVSATHAGRKCPSRFERRMDGSATLRTADCSAISRGVGCSHLSLAGADRYRLPGTTSHRRQPAIRNSQELPCCNSTRGHPGVAVKPRCWRLEERRRYRHEQLVGCDRSAFLS
jgi:hypothetical protein